jgi:hypothetical protein
MKISVLHGIFDSVKTSVIYIVHFVFSISRGVARIMEKYRHKLFRREDWAA